MKTKTIVFKKAKKLRRIGSAVIDLLFSLVLTLIIALFVSAIISRTSSYKNAYARYQEIMTDSYIYELNDNGQAVIINNDYDNKITLFFDNHTENGIDYYNNLKKESGLFDETSPGVYVIKEGTDEKSLTDFYQSILRKLTDSKQESYKYFNGYLTSVADAGDVYNRLYSFLIIEIMISFLLAFLIYYLAIPMIRKDNRTFGKMMFRLQIYSKKENLQPKKIQILFRELVFIFFELLISIYTVVTFFVPVTLLISLIMAMFTKYDQSFHDLVCQTFVVDDEMVNNQTRESDKIYISVVEDENG